MVSEYELFRILSSDRVLYLRVLLAVSQLLQPENKHTHNRLQLNYDKALRSVLQCSFLEQHVAMALATFMKTCAYLSLVGQKNKCLQKEVFLSETIPVSASALRESSIISQNRCLTALNLPVFSKNTHTHKLFTGPAKNFNHRLE